MDAACAATERKLYFRNKLTKEIMEIEGKIIAVLPARGGTSARTGNAWKSQEFVIETFDQYPRKCVFRVFGEDRLNQMNIQLGEVLRVSFDIDAHEYNGRWFNDVSAWRVDRNVGPAQPQPAPAQPAPAPMPGNNDVMPSSPAGAPQGGAPIDDLPF